MLQHSMMLALRAIRDGRYLTRAEHFWLRSQQYINEDNTLTMKGHNELSNDDNSKGDKPKC